MPVYTRILCSLFTLVLLGPASLSAQQASPPTAQANAVHSSLNVDDSSAPAAPASREAEGDAVENDRLAALARRLAAAPAAEQDVAEAVAAPAGVNAESSPDAQSTSLAPSPLNSPASPSTTAVESDLAPPPPPVSDKERMKLGPAGNDRDGEGTAIEGPGSSWILGTLGALGLVIALVFLLRAAISRLTGQPIATSSSAVVEVLARVSVAPRSHLLLVRLGQKILVLGDGAAGLRTLAQLDDPDEVADILRAVTSSRPNSVTQSFSHLMSRFSGDYSDRDRQSDEGGDTAEIHIDQARDQVSGLLSRVRGMARGS